MVLHRAERDRAGAGGNLGHDRHARDLLAGVRVTGEFDAEQILGAPFSTMMNESIVPLSHILWSHVWLGIATEAFERGRAFVRAAARRKPGEPVPAAHSCRA